MHALNTSHYKDIHIKCFLPKKLQTQASKAKDDEPPPPPFAGMKLKPRKPVQRKPIEEPKDTQPFKVDLKHHEFEKPPQTEEVNIEEIIKILIYTFQK